MPLVAAALGAAIKTELVAALDIQDTEQLELVANAIGKAVVEYIAANALVSGTGVCSTGGGPVTGTIT